MEFEDYQRQAAQTDQNPNESGLTVALMGLGGEVGSILSEFKKKLRDGPAHEHFEAMIAEELGDVLWYVSTIASHLNLDLDEIAMTNLNKLQERWPPPETGQAPLGFPRQLPDTSYPAHEQLPRRFAFRFEEEVQDGRRVVRVYNGREAVGDPLKDNAYDEDGYRYHDVFHYAYAAVLGWSPVLRNTLRPKCKRKSNTLVDEVEDGGRAQVIEEGIAAFVFDYAKKHGFLQHAKTLDYDLLKTIKSLTAGLEVSRCSYRDWEEAILVGFEVWRQLKQRRSGVVVGDLMGRRIWLEGG